MGRLTWSPVQIPEKPYPFLKKKARSRARASLTRTLLPEGEGSDGQALAALGAASVDDLAAILAGHTLQETVDGTALTLFRLESLFHFTYPPVPMWHGGTLLPRALRGEFRCLGYAPSRDSLADYDYSPSARPLSTPRTDFLPVVCVFSRIFGKGSGIRPISCCRAVPHLQDVSPLTAWPGR